METLIGRLATDEALRLAFHRDRTAVLDAMAAEGAQFTPVERQAILDLDLGACDRFAEKLDPRIQKVCLRRNP